MSILGVITIRYNLKLQDSKSYTNNIFNQLYKAIIGT